MDYKKKYEEALEKGREFYNRLDNKQLKEEVESIFPELVVSEDERIRQHLIDMCKTLGKSEWIAWLEKQGEQKPADKVEPKFKVGDWICHNVYKKPLLIVEDLGEGDFRTEPKSIITAKEFREGVFRLWTIQDAKDGDVLYSIDSKQPFIYKERPQYSQAIGYCCINKFGEFAIWNTNKCVICTDKYIPVTKEQRAFLFQKMHEAGYEWDAERKELRKIEQKPAEWSEEDESRMENLCHFLKEYGNQYYGALTLEGTINWLKSLRPQSHWRPSESQIDLISEAIGFFGAHSAKGLLMIELRNNIKKLTE